MTIKRFTLVLALLALLAAGVSAHDENHPEGYAVLGRWYSGPEVLLQEPIIHEATGHEAEPLREALQEGKTLSELIEANDSDVEAVVADLVAQASDSIQAQAAASIDGLEESFTEAMSESHRRRFPWWRRRNIVRNLFGAWDMDATITAATGLDKAELNAALNQGETIEELIEANEGDLASVVSTLVEQASAGINEAAAARIQRYEESVTDLLAADYSDETGRWRKGRSGPRGFFSYWSMHHKAKPTMEETSES